MLGRRPRILAFFLAVLAGIPAGAATSPNLGKEALEEIRGAAIRYYAEKKPRLWKVFVEELKRGGIFPKEEFPEIGPSIGIWKCETDEDGILLVRDPGLDESGAPLSIYFYVRLIKKDGRWTAVEHSYREVRWQRGPLEETPPGRRQ